MNDTNRIHSLTSESKKLFTLLYKKGPLTKADLMEQTGYTRTSLNRFINPLIEEELILPTDEKAHTKGRPRITFDVNPSKYWVFGVDISRAYVNVISMNLKNEIRSLKTITVTKETNGRDLLSDITDYIKSHKDYSMAMGVGIALVSPLDYYEMDSTNHTSSNLSNMDSADPGSSNLSDVDSTTLGSSNPTDSDSSQSIGMPHHFSSLKEDLPNDSWHDLKVKEVFEASLDIPVFSEKGAQLAVLAEHLFGFGKGTNNCAFINVGFGIRSGIILDKRLISSIPEDSLAHINVKNAISKSLINKQCTCGRQNCLKTTSTINTLLDQTNERFNLNLKDFNQFSTYIIKKDQDKNNNLIFKANNHQAPLTDLFEESTTALAYAINQYATLLNLDRIVLTGPLIKDYQDYQNQLLIKLNQNQHINLKIGGTYGHQSFTTGSAVYTILNLFK